MEFADDYPGVFCQFDLFGTDSSYYQMGGDIDYPSDLQRMNLMKAMKDEGKVDRLLVAQDIHTKDRLVS